MPVREKKTDEILRCNAIKTNNLKLKNGRTI
jgi:hypothetical protein